MGDEKGRDRIVVSVRLSPSRRRAVPGKGPDTRRVQGHWPTAVSCHTDSYTARQASHKNKDRTEVAYEIIFTVCRFAKIYSVCHSVEAMTNKCELYPCKDDLWSS